MRKWPSCPAYTFTCVMPVLLPSSWSLLARFSQAAQILCIGSCWSEHTIVYNPTRGYHCNKRTLNFCGCAPVQRADKQRASCQRLCCATTCARSTAHCAMLSIWLANEIGPTKAQPKPERQTSDMPAGETRVSAGRACQNPALSRVPVSAAAPARSSNQMKWDLAHRHRRQQGKRKRDHTGMRSSTPT